MFVAPVVTSLGFCNEDVLLDNAPEDCFCVAVVDGEIFGAVFVAVGEGGVAYGGVSRGKVDGGTIDGKDGATMASYISMLL
jgi:hypothetical protein